MSALEALKLGPVPVELLLEERQSLEGKLHLAENARRAKLLDAAIRDAWGTPPELFAALHAAASFTVDVAAEPWNAKLPRWYGVGGEIGDGLRASWVGETWFCNPPFSQVETWVRYAWSWYDPDRPRAGPGVMVLPATRTEQDWWQHSIEPYRDNPVAWAQLRCEFRVRFLPGRTYYVPPPNVPESSPRFGSCVLSWRPI